MTTNLPKIYNLAYAQARKSGNGYRLYWRGTCNEIFPGEIFRSPAEAKQYLHVQILKSCNVQSDFEK